MGGKPTKQVRFSGIPETPKFKRFLQEESGETNKMWEEERKRLNKPDFGRKRTNKKKNTRSGRKSKRKSPKKLKRKYSHR